ncbi:reverse transcriptase [Trichonephila clavipes]|nr:reverse transcriptase [Trichonephila clavipes]
MEWVSSHVGIPGNIRAKQGVGSSEVPLTLRGAKSIIATYIDKCIASTQKSKSPVKSWETTASVGPVPRHLERAETVASFRLTRVHEFFGVYLSPTGLE